MTTARRPLALPSSLFLLVMLAAAAVPAIPALPPSQEPGKAPRHGGTIRIKGAYTPFNQVFDPALPSHYFITEQLFDGLVKFDSRFNPIPALAEYWMSSNGGARITFYLRRGVRFHNGRELTADDVKYSLERLIRVGAGRSSHQYFTDKVIGAEEYRLGKATGVTGFRVVDPLTFEIDWKRPYVAGLYLLGMYYCKILPKDLLESQGRSFFQKPVGTGPFKFAEWLRSPRLDILGVRLERNNAYFGRQAYLAALEYSPYFTEDQFEEGSVHLVSVTSERMLRKRYPVLENNTLKSYVLAFSCDTPPLDRPEVRRALAVALDKPRLAEACDSPATLHQVLDNYIPPLLPGFFPRAAGSFSDTDAAKLLLDRLLPQEGRKALTLTLLCDAPKTDESSGFARELERELGALEIKLEVKYLRKPEEALTIRTPYLRFLPYTMDFPDPENIIGPLYRSSSPLNAANARYANSRLDALLDQSEVETSWEKRTALFREIEKILFTDVPAVPLFSDRIRIAIQPEVRGVQLPAMGFIFLDVKDIWLGDREKP
jgi:ABC-type transport system substrate-binding protein